MLELIVTNGGTKRGLLAPPSSFKDVFNIQAFFPESKRSQKQLPTNRRTLEAETEHAILSQDI
eukprot:3337445-Pleurochrysis_carterae.AAC.7